MRRINFLVVLCYFLFFFTSASSQQINPRNLPQCPPPDVSKTVDIGSSGRTHKWHYCWGRYEAELPSNFKGDVYEGEWLNGTFNGLGTYNSLANNQFKGAKYVGEHKDGKYNGHGTYTFVNGNKYVGQFKDSKKHGQGILTTSDGRRLEGIFENDKFLRESKVNLPDQNNGVVVNSDQIDIRNIAKDLKEKINSGALPSCASIYNGLTQEVNFKAREKCWGRDFFTLNFDFIYDKEIREISVIWKDGKPSGIAHIVYSSGDQYTGNIFNGKKYGVGYYKYLNGDEYFGEFSDGAFNGQGIYLKKNNSISEGIWQRDKLVQETKVDLVKLKKYATANIDGSKIESIPAERENILQNHKNSNGLKVCTPINTLGSGDAATIRSWDNCWGMAQFFSSGVKEYEGEWRLGSPNGFGELTLSNGARYKGKFKNQMIEGFGSFVDETNNVYIGNFKDNFFEGLGRYSYAKGGFYFGEWKRGRRHGKGINSNAENEIREGIWQDNVLISSAKVSLPTIESFIGESSLGEGSINKKQITVSSDLPVSELQICQGADKSKWYKCFGVINETWGSYIGEFENGVFQGKGKATFAAGSTYAGEFRDGKANGFGKYQSPKGEIYIGEFKDYMNHGKGILLDKNGSIISEGIFEFGKIVRAEKTNINLTSDRSEKFPRERASNISRLNLEISHTEPNADGDFLISINTNSDTSSLKINGEEFGGRSDGKYSINRVARAGQETQFSIFAKDVSGKSETKMIAVSRPVVDSKVVYAALNPVQVKRQVERDAVAIIIGISNYKTLPKAEFANDDARVFYDYAVRALGVKPDNIKLLVDSDADELEIIKAFKTWLPSRVKSTTDVYVFYSGHGLPTQDGQGLYLLPPRADRDFISRTSIQFQEINADLQAAKPKSVTIFMDACYSGQARSGETLVANARPVTLKSEKKLFPDNFTVITASQADQISSSSPDLKHGIFSYYLMKGMEGDADANRDGKITLGEMQAYLVENVGRQAGMMSRKQEPQLIGEAGRILVGR